jgi:hypothetical protein
MTDDDRSPVPSRADPQSGDDAPPAGGAPSRGAAPLTADTVKTPPASQTLRRALPAIIVIALVSLAPLWGALSAGWSVLAVVFVFVADGAADGLTSWQRARTARGGDPEQRESDRVLVSEFVRTYFVIVASMALILYLVFSGRLFRPGGVAPKGAYDAFSTWQFWAIIAAFFLARWFVYWWDWKRGGEAAFMPPAGVVSAPLRRLFVLQFGVLAGGLVVYWLFSSSSGALAVLVVVIAAAEVVLAVLERLRTARVRAAVEAGVKPRPRGSGAATRAAAAPSRAQPRGGRKRKRR